MPFYELDSWQFRRGPLLGKFRIRTQSIPPERSISFGGLDERKSIVFSLGDDSRPGPRDSVFHSVLDEFCEQRQDFVNRSARISLVSGELVVQAVDANGVLIGQEYHLPFVSPIEEAAAPAQQIYLRDTPSD